VVLPVVQTVVITRSVLELIWVVPSLLHGRPEVSNPLSYAPCDLWNSLCSEKKHHQSEYQEDLHDSEAKHTDASFQQRKRKFPPVPRNPGSFGDVKDDSLGAWSERGVARSTSATLPQTSLEKDLGDGLKLHVGGPLVDGSDLGVPVELFHRIVPRESVPAKEVYGH